MTRNGEQAKRLLSAELEDLPIMILSRRLDLEAGERIYNNASKALETWLMYAQRYYQLRPNGTDSEHFGLHMLKNSEIRVSSDLNYENVTKEIRGDFLAGEARTDIAMRAFTDYDITIRLAGILYNQHKLNLEILKQVYQMSGPVNNEDSGGGNGLMMKLNRDSIEHLRRNSESCVVS